MVGIPIAFTTKLKREECLGCLTASPGVNEPSVVMLIAFKWRQEDKEMGAIPTVALDFLPYQCAGRASL